MCTGGPPLLPLDPFNKCIHTPLPAPSKDLIKEYFRSSIDDLKRERALFEGPPPLLLASMNVEDLCILLSGSDHNTSQVVDGGMGGISPQHNTGGARERSTAETDGVDEVPSAVQVGSLLDPFARYAALHGG